MITLKVDKSIDEPQNPSLNEEMLLEIKIRHHLNNPPCYDRQTLYVTRPPQYHDM